MYGIKKFTQDNIKELPDKRFISERGKIGVWLVKWRCINAPVNESVKRRILCALDRHEKEKSERFIREEDRYRNLFSRGIVKLIGAHFAEVPVHEINISAKENGKGKKRHPTIEDNVTVYSGASILGGDTVVGEGPVIGGNAFVTESVPKNSRILMKPLIKCV